MIDDADAIVVLGAALRPDGGETPALRRRVVHACGLFHRGRAPAVVLVGGFGRRTPPPLSEARAMHRIARAEGVPDDCLVLEERSTRTIENAACTAALMAARGWRTAALVTDAFHMPRALFAFRRFGVAVMPDPVPEGADDRPWARYAVRAREAAAFAIYAWLFASGRAERIARAARADGGAAP